MVAINKSITKDALSEYYKYHSIKETANHFGVSVGCIAGRVKVWSLHKRKIAQKKQKPDAKEFKEYLLWHSHREVAEHFALSLSTIDRLIQEYELVGLQKMIVVPKTYKLPMPTKEDFSELYYKEPLHKVASYYGVSENLIVKWRQQLNIPLKGPRGQSCRELPNIFTSRQQEIIIGSLLGDGCLRRITGPWANSYFVESHCSAQKPYLQFKYDELIPFSNSLESKNNYKVISIDRKKYKVDYTQTRESFAFSTFSSPLFTELEKKWYKRNDDGIYEYMTFGKTKSRIKILPEDLTLTPLTVAIWYYDDGSTKWRDDWQDKKNHRSKWAMLHSMNFSEEECNRLVGMLQSIGISHCKMTKDRSIAITSKSYSDFIEMVKPHLPHECLRYKVEYDRIKHEVDDDS